MHLKKVDGFDDRLKVPTQLPNFSKTMEISLSSGIFWMDDSLRGQFMSEVALFYSTNNILLNKRSQSKAVCITILAKYENFKRHMNKICDSEN